MWLNAEILMEIMYQIYTFTYYIIYILYIYTYIFEILDTILYYRLSANLYYFSRIITMYLFVLLHDARPQIVLAI